MIALELAAWIYEPKAVPRELQKLEEEYNKETRDAFEYLKRLIEDTAVQIKKEKQK